LAEVQRNGLGTVKDQVACAAPLAEAGIDNDVRSMLLRRRGRRAEFARLLSTLKAKRPQFGRTIAAARR